MRPIHAGQRSGLSSRGRERVAVVGAGIVGLAHAWSAARRGHEVLLFERTSRARGASIRNFGMIWPIGQQPGRNHHVALRSRALWLELLRSAKIWHRECGSLHLAFRDDEMAVLSEFADQAEDLGYDSRLISASQVAEVSPAARREGLLGGLRSDSELCVDPRQVVATMPRWLEEQHGVQLHFGTAIQRVSMPWITATDGERWQVDRVIVAAGADLKVIFPTILAQARFRLCKLQMMRTVPQAVGWQLGPMLAGGLTLRHYPTFTVCPSLNELKRRIATETPELEHYGIHVMASQNGGGEVILGDSHEYDDDIRPFDKAVIEELVLRELHEIMDLPDWTIQERWHGVYALLPGKVQFVHEVEPGVTIVTGAGGCGMTMSFGLAEESWDAWDSGEVMDGAPSADGRPAIV